ncbi:MAG TPA: hypothetical protein DCQ06_14030 [Myxococcales bacterium]|nr:hypothetical protein [Myxococcales bacterium]HAN32707.1 hypothetical protein [Myxococcales bacterium]
MTDESSQSDPGSDSSLKPQSEVKNQYEIRILSDGRVVFGDLPQGLAEVAQIVAGSEPGPIEPSESPAGTEDQEQ